MAKFNITITFTDGLATTIQNKQAENRQEAFLNEINDPWNYKDRDILTITVVEVKPYKGTIAIG